MQGIFFTEILTRFSEPEEVKSWVLDFLSKSSRAVAESVIGWEDLSLASGYPGFLFLLSLCEQIGKIDEGKLSYGYVLRIKEAIETEGFQDLSLFCGTAGVCWALRTASGQDQKYHRMIDALDTYLLEKLPSIYLEPIVQSIPGTVPASKYDAIQGICGIGRYCLEYRNEPRLHRATQEILQALVSIIKPITLYGHTVPGWYVSPEDKLNESTSLLSKGNFNTGVAHGISGLLAFLSLAWISDVRIAGQKEAMLTIYKWLVSRSFEKPGGIYWKDFISWEEEISGEMEPFLHSRDAWCYGAPGIARAIFLCGKALCSREMKEFGKTVFENVLFNDQRESNLFSSCLCHGTSGLLLLTYSMSLEPECSHFTRYIDGICRKIDAVFSYDHAFGFEDIEHLTSGETVRISKPGLLDGAAGVLLATLIVEHRETAWSAPFLM